MSERTCSVPGCNKKMLARGWCSGHWNRWRDTGDVRADVPLRPFMGGIEPVARFWAKVNKHGPVGDFAPHLGNCWVWLASIRNGYGMFGLDGRANEIIYAHRFAYELANGPIPEDLELDHLCRVRACVRPDHLEPVSHAENCRRGHWGLIDHCPQGHPYDAANTLWRKGGRSRVCRECNRQRCAARAARLR